MNSTYASNTLLACNQIGLYYKIDTYQKGRAKDKILSHLSSPLSIFKGSQTQSLTVFQSLSFSIQSGERVGIIGLNGAGKTSLCRMLAGIIKPSKGTVYTNGDVRAIFNTSVGILPELTGRENAELISHILYPHYKKEEIANIVAECIDFCDLGDFIDVPFAKYSRGMQARLSLALVTAKSCDVLILDEVFDGADEPFQHKMKNRVESLIKQSGATVLVSHQMEFIKNYCTRVILLSDQGITFDGTPSDAVLAFRKLSENDRRKII